MSKLVSVVVPNWNCGEYIDKCLASVAGQTYKNIEILVCDNGSTDNSRQVIENWVKKDSRVRALYNPTNEGGLKCYNKLYTEAKGEYIAIQDSDDWCDPQRIEKQAAILDKYDVGCCMTNSIFYYDHIEPEYPNQRGSGITDISKEDWAPATIMFRRSVLNEIPGYNLYWDRLTSYDNYFIMSVIDKFGGYYLDEYLYFVKARPNSDHRTIELKDPHAMRKLLAYDIYKFLRKQRMETGTDWLKEGNMDALRAHEQKMLNDKDYIANKLRGFACIQVDHGKYKNAWALLKQAIIVSPTFMQNYRSLGYLLRSMIKK